MFAFWQTETLQWCTEPSTLQLEDFFNIQIKQPKTNKTEIKKKPTYKQNHKYYYEVSNQISLQKIWIIKIKIIELILNDHVINCLLKQDYWYDTHIAALSIGQYQ